MLVGFVLTTLKWLLIVALVLLGIGLLTGWRPGRSADKSGRTTTLR
jgi:hypothetical protein